jgi:hypothetical protein
VGKYLDWFILVVLIGTLAVTWYGVNTDTQLQSNLAAMYEYADANMTEVRVVDVACFRKNRHCVAAVLDHQDNYVYIGAKCDNGLCVELPRTH